MEMTFDEYINNPSGAKSMVFTNRQVYYNLYKEKLDKVLVRETGKINYFLYTDKKSGEYYIHFKIPSEVLDKFYYDVVVQFIPKNKLSGMSRSLKDYNVKFFSNDPAFVFTFDHAMIKNKMFITDLESKTNKDSLKSKAVTRNPKDQIGYVKSIYFAYLTMMTYKLFDKVMFESYAKPYDKKELLSNIEHADNKIADRQRLGEELNKSNKIAKTKEHVKKSSENRFNDNLSSEKTKNTPTNNKFTNRSKMTKRTHSVKRTKKI